jgi:prevent-host-death family protein
MTKMLSISQARGRLSRFVDRVEKRSATYAITKKGQTRALLISREEYESLKATIEVASNKEELAGIQRGIAELKAGHTVSFEEVFGEPLNAEEDKRGQLLRHRS